MRYVNDDWETVGINESCAQPQLGRAETALPDDHPALVAYGTPPVPGVAPLSAEELYDMLATKGVLAGADRPRPRP